MRERRPASSAKSGPATKSAFVQCGVLKGGEPQGRRAKASEWPLQIGPSGGSASTGSRSVLLRAGNVPSTGVAGIDLVGRCKRIWSNQ
jgi:hypothetical protein